jgi:hypothetical protein
MKVSDFELAAWIRWNVFFDEPEPTDAHRNDDQALGRQRAQHVERGGSRDSRIAVSGC